MLTNRSTMDAPKGAPVSSKRYVLMKMLLLLAMLGSLVACGETPSDSELAKAQLLIKKIDERVKKDGTIPSESEVRPLMEQLGLDPTETCRPCYTAREDEYLVSFGTTLGSSYTYYSNNRKWVHY